MNAVAKFEQAISALGRLLSDRPGLAKRVGTFDVNIAKAAIDEFRDIDARLTALEKRAASEQAARLDFAADSDSDRMSQLEAERSVLKARHGPAAHVEGLAKTLGLGLATQAETEQSQSTGRPVDWRQ